MHILAQVYTVA